MLRFLYTSCEILATACAIFSPVAILHWLLKSVNVPAISKAVSALDSLFSPLNAILELILPKWTLNYGGHELALTQAFLALLLTIGFFLLNFIAESLKAGEQRLDVERQAMMQRRRLKSIQADEQKKKKQVLTRQRVLLHIQYNFLDSTQGARYLEEHYARYGGTLAEHVGTGFTLSFESLERALSYCLEASQSILSYYATLRPVDPQPPFAIVIHAVEPDLSHSASMGEARNLIKFVAPNQMVFSDDVRALMDAKGKTTNYRFQSMGLYGMSDGRQMELYRLISGTI